jgi:hypothetical protein
MAGALLGAEDGIDCPAVRSALDDITVRSGVVAVSDTVVDLLRSASRHGSVIARAGHVTR